MFFSFPRLVFSGFLATLCLGLPSRFVNHQSTSSSVDLSKKSLWDALTTELSQWPFTENFAVHVRPRNNNKKNELVIISPFHLLMSHRSNPFDLLCFPTGWGCVRGPVSVSARQYDDAHAAGDGQLVQVALGSHDRRYCRLMLGCWVRLALSKQTSA